MNARQRKTLDWMMKRLRKDGGTEEKCALIRKRLEGMTEEDFATFTKFSTTSDVQRLVLKYIPELEDPQWHRI